MTCGVGMVVDRGGGSQTRLFKTVYLIANFSMNGLQEKMHILV